MNGGHLEGYNLNNRLKEEVLNGLNKLMDKKAFAKKYGVKEKKFYYLPLEMEITHYRQRKQFMKI